MCTVNVTPGAQTVHVRHHSAGSTLPRHCLLSMVFCFLTAFWSLCFVLSFKTRTTKYSQLLFYLCESLISCMTFFVFKVVLTVPRFILSLSINNAPLYTGQIRVQLLMLCYVSFVLWLYMGCMPCSKSPKI